MNTIGFAVEDDLSSVWAGQIRGDKGGDREKTMQLFSQDMLD